MILGFILGMLTASLVHHTIGEYIAHSDCATNLDFVAALWVAWPFFSRAWMARKAFLHPPVRRYKLPLKQVFANIRQVLCNSTYNFGDKWYVSSADTMQKRIIACLRFADEEQRVELSSSPYHTNLRKERKQRLLELEIQMEEDAGDNTIVQLDFRATVEGVSFHACDRIIYSFLNDLQTVLGPGEVAYQQDVCPRLVPPWWLIAITALCLLGLTGAVGSHISNSWQKVVAPFNSARTSEIAAGVRTTER